ncbi:unnamed protein product [Sphenostylis stenocarpa]|uniref:Uncharacterized protein n=1 Tax=Sphenostylis stenocarpa TaxID=92480 RepID=A0AA86V4T7_9FABA|nr:unnamed protein product [Sphenostylis stenocarpa]
MEEAEECTNANQKFNTKRRSFRNGSNSHEHHRYHHHLHHHHHHYQHHHQLLQHSTQLGFCNNHNKYQRYYPALLPLPSLIPLQQLPLTPPFPQNHTIKSKTHLDKPPCKLNSSPSSDYKLAPQPLAPGKH